MIGLRSDLVVFNKKQLPQLLPQETASIRPRCTHFQRISNTSRCIHKLPCSPDQTPVDIVSYTHPHSYSRVPHMSFPHKLSSPSLSTVQLFHRIHMFED